MATNTAAPGLESRTTLPLAAQVGLLAGPFLSMVDGSIVNVALPTIASQFHASLASAQWVVSGYLLALAAALAGTAYVERRFGTNRVYLVSLVGFTGASALCALTPSLGILIAARAVQGALGAPLVPLAMGMMLGKGGSARQMPATAGILLFLAPALGPTAGGLLIHAAGWPLIFLVNLPVGILGAVSFRRTALPAGMKTNPAARLDAVGLVLLAIGLTTTIYGATEGPQQGWLAGTVWPYLVAGGLLLALYCLWAWRRPHPAVNLTLLRHPQTALAVGLSALASVVMFAVLILVPIYLEDVQGLSPLVAGLALLPQGLVTGLGTVLGNRLAGRHGLRLSALAGMGALTVTTALLLLVTIGTPAWLTAILLTGRGLAIGLVIQPLTFTIYEGLPASEVPDANTLFSVAQRLGGSLGIPLVVTFFQVRERLHIDSALRQAGLHASNLSQTSGHTLPPAARDLLARAAASGFHDTIGLLIVVSSLGCLAAAFLRRGSVTIT